MQLDMPGLAQLHRHGGGELARLRGMRRYKKSRYARLLARGMITSALSGICERSESCNGRGVRKSNSPVMIMVGVLIDDNLDVNGSKLRKDSMRFCRA